MYFQYTKIISEKIEIDFSEKNYDSILDIIYGITSNFLLGAAISIESILKYNNNAYRFHLFTDKISKTSIEHLKETAKKNKVHIIIYIINNDDLSFLPCTERWPYATYYRIIGFDILSENYTKALYLDADIMCKGNISDLNSLDLSDKILAAVPDTKKFQERAKEINIIKDGLYFNSGMMLANLILWKNENITQKTLEHLKLNIDNSLFPDQDTLNVIMNNKVYYLNKAYNFFYGVDTELKNKDIQLYKNVLTDNIKLIHYVGVSKPWHIWGNYPSSKYFLDIYKSSIWNNIPLEAPNTIKQMKKKSSHERLQKKYLSSFISHLKYIHLKIKNKF